MFTSIIQEQIENPNYKTLILKVANCILIAEMVELYLIQIKPAKTSSTHSFHRRVSCNNQN